MKKLFKKGIVVLLLLALFSSNFGANIVIPAYAAGIKTGTFGTANWSLETTPGNPEYGVLHISAGEFAAGQGNWSTHFSDIEKIVFDGPVTANEDSSKMFDGLKNLLYIEGLEKLDTSAVKNMRQMFYNCKKLVGESAVKSLDLTNFNTENVTTMRSMFGNCNALKQLDLSSFNIKSVITTQAMFYRCINLESVEFMRAEPAVECINLTSMRTMFYQCDKLKSVDLSGFDISKVETTYKMFYQCNELESVKFSSSATQQSINTAQDMFKQADKLSYLQLGSNMKLPNATLLNPVANANFTGKWINIYDPGVTLDGDEVVNQDPSKGIYIWEQNIKPTVQYQFAATDGSGLPQVVLAQLPNFNGNTNHIDEIEIGPSYALISPTQTEVAVADGKWFFKGYSLQGTSQIISEIAPVDSYDPFTVVGKWQFKPAVVADNPNDSDYVKVTFAYGDHASGFGGTVDSEVWALKDSLASDVFSFANLAYNGDDNLIIAAGYNFLHYTDAADVVVDATTTVGTSNQVYTAQYSDKSMGAKG